MKRDEDWTAFPVYFINGFVVGILIPVNGWGKEQTQRNKSLKVKEWMESYLQQNKKGKRGFKRGSLSFILSLFGIALVHMFVLLIGDPSLWFVGIFLFLPSVLILHSHSE